MNYSKVESYLTALEKELNSLSTSERAEIVLEIKSHIMTKLEEQPEGSVDSILASLGSPKDVAMKYLDDRGIEWKPTKGIASALASIFKWSVIGFLGTMAIGAIVSVFVISMFSPLVEVDEEKGKVKILGGAIDIDEFDSRDVNIRFDTTTSDEFEEIYVIENIDELKQINIESASGNMKLENGDRDIIEVECRTSNAKVEKLIQRNQDESINIDLAALGSSRCEIELPRNIPIQWRNNSGVVRINRVENPIALTMSSGRVQFKPSKGVSYNYDLSLKSGRIDEFFSSNAKDSLPIKIEMQSGRIQNW